MNKIAIFASGSGTNAQRIADYFKDNNQISVTLILSNKPDAFVLERAKKANIPTQVFNKDDFKNKDKMLALLSKHNINFIVLAGFLWLIPEYLIDAYPKKIVNIHPALLPKYGGKGMYGMNVHQAVVDNKEKESGITIHLVNKEYDKGAILFQATCPVEANDTAEMVAHKIHELEYRYFPEVIEKTILS